MGLVVPAPTNLVATTQFGPQVSLTFTDNATNETGFVLERSSNGGTTFTTLATLPAKTGTGNISYIDTTTVAGRSYVYRVKAINGTVSSAYSNAVTVNLPAAPLVPSGLTLSLQTSWACHRRSVSPSRTTPPTRPASSSSDRPEWIGVRADRDPRRLPRRRYRDLHRCHHPFQHGGRGVCLSRPPGQWCDALGLHKRGGLRVQPAPAAPSRSPRLPGALGQIQLNWVPGSSNATQYVIERSTSSSFSVVDTFTTAGSATQLLLSGMVSGTTYYFRIKAQNLYGESTWVLLASSSVVVL